LLVEALERVGFHATVTLGPHGQLEQEILTADATLRRKHYDGVLLVLGLEDLLAPIYARPLSYSKDQMRALVDNQSRRIAGLTAKILEVSAMTVVYLVIVGTDNLPMAAVLAPDATMRGQTAVESLACAMRAISGASPQIVVVDWDWNARAEGMSSLSDPRLWYLARMRLNHVGLACIAQSVAHHVAANCGLSRKVAVFDLDDTIWGGIVGEVGVSGLVLGEDGIGLAFQDFQRELLKLRDAGVILAACSKNNIEEAWEVFDRHPGMVLRREHLSAARINWQDKATSIVELATELRLGVESFVFFDDNRVERDWIRRSLPGVLVPELSADPTERPAALRRAEYFQRIRVTREDVARADTYQAERERTQLLSATSTFEDFLQSLEQEVSIEAVHEGSLARAAQLCQRTNQFNLTTQRYTTADIQALIHRGDVEVYTLAVQDRFGDSGITGLAIVRYSEATADIDSFLLSCRILGRRVEDAFFAFLIRRVRERGATTLIGRYFPTAKNQQVASFYLDRGFVPIGDGGYQLDVSGPIPEIPPQIKLKAPVNG
jgi:FkbH-like protein